MRKTSIQISAVAKVVAKEELAQLKRLALHPGLKFAPPKKTRSLCFSKKDYNASSSIIYNFNDVYSSRSEN